MAEPMGEKLDYHVPISKVLVLFILCPSKVTYTQNTPHSIFWDFLMLEHDQKSKTAGLMTYMTAYSFQNSFPI